MSFLDKTSKAPFYNDYNKDLNFLAVVFDPTRAAIQARELTQAQTILQNQIAQLAGHVFANNSLVYGGEIDFNRKKPTAIIEPTYYDEFGVSTGVTIDPKTLIGKVYSNSSDSSDMTITHAQILNNKLYIYYSFTGVNFSPNELCAPQTGTLTYIKMNSGLSKVNFHSTSVRCNPGIIYRDGFFITIVEQEKIIAHTNSGRISAGYRFEEDIVGVDDPYYGNTLKDPANGSYNFNAPGASRFRITPILDGFEDDDSDTNREKIWSIQDGSEIIDGRNVQIDDFFQKYREIVVQQDGNVILDFQEPIYGAILDMIARRTYDESGDYTISDFKVKATKSSDPDTFLVRVGEGKAYVRGYEREHLTPTFLEVDRARTHKTTTYGKATSDGLQYLVLDQEVSSSEEMLTNGGGSGSEHAPFENFTQVKFYDVNDVDIGRGYLATITRQSSEYRAYFRGVANAIPNIKNVSYFQKEGVGNMKYYVAPSDEGIRFYGNGNKPFIYPIEGTIYTKSVGDLEFDTNLEITITSDGSGNINIVRGVGEVEFYDHNNGGIIMVQETVTGTQIDVDSLSATGGNNNTISGATLTINTEYRLILKARMIDAQQRTKSLATIVDQPITIESDLDTLNFSSATESENEDIYDIISIKEVGAGANYTFTDAELKRLTLDNGQRNHWYKSGKITGLSNVGITKGGSGRQFLVTYRYYVHSAPTERSQFFTVNSYFTDHSADLSNIKPYSRQVKSYNLVNSIDFRRKFSELSATGGMNVLHPYSTARFTYDTYIPRADRVYIDSDGVIAVQTGIPSGSNEPELSPELDNVMTLATYEVPAYTPNLFNVKIITNDNRRYTMRDIGKIEDRVEALEYYSSLNALEKSAYELSVFDNNGFDRFKNGIFVDPFANHEIGNTFDPEYRVVTYPGGGMTCPFEATAIEFDNDTNITPTVPAKEYPELIVGELSTSKNLCHNFFASTCINVNPYLYGEWEGTVKLTPSIDTWTETRYDPDEELSGLVLFGNATSTGGFGTNSQDNARIIWELGSDWTDWGQWMGLDRNTWRTFANNRFSAQSSLGSREQTVGDTTITSTYTGSGNTAFSSVTTDRLVSNENAAYARPLTVTYEIEGFRPGVPITGTLAGESVALSNTLVDGSGKATGTFDIPEFTIPTGVSLFQVTDAAATSTAETNFTSSGVIERRARKTINVTWHDPLAQSFLVDSVGGALLESVDLYIRTKPDAGSSDDYPLSISIVEMLNGYPTQNQLRYSHVSLDSTAVNATATSADPDSVVLGKTTFTFDNPVYVEDGVEYAIVVASESAGYCAWVSVLGEQNVFDDGLATGAGMTPSDPTRPISNAPSATLSTDQINAYNETAWSPNEVNMSADEFAQVNSNRSPTTTSPAQGNTVGGTGAGISKQPYLGSLFLSQNSSTWTADQMKDLTFSIKQLQFVTNSESYYIAKDNKQDQFGDYSIYGDTETFAFGAVADNQTFVTSRSLKNLTEADLIVTHNDGSTDTVLSAFASPIEYTLDSANNTITLTNPLIATESVTIDTRSTFLRRNQNQGSTLFLNLGQFVLPGTDLTHQFSNVKNDLPGLDGANTLSSGSVIPNRQNLMLDSEVVLDDGVLGHSTSPDVDVNNFWIQNAFSTGNANISPIIEKQAYRMVLVRNLAIPLNSLDNLTNTNRWATGKYISKTVELLNEAEDLRVIVDAKLPTNSKIRVYYRTVESDTSYVAINKTTSSFIDNHNALRGQEVQVLDLDSGILTLPLNDRAFVSGVNYVESGYNTYNAANDYEVGDKVFHTIGGQLYGFVCTVAHTSGSPDTPIIPTPGGAHPVSNWVLYDDNAYLTNIGDESNFDNITDGFLIPATENIIASTTCPNWVSAVAGTYTTGSYVLYNNNIWKATKDNGPEVPTDLGTAWDKIPTIRFLNTGVLSDTDFAEWKPMKFTEDNVDTTVAQSEFVEFTYEPEIEPTNAFDDFAIKVEMESTNKVDMPIIKNLRAIAVN